MHGQVRNVSPVFNYYSLQGNQNYFQCVIHLRIEVTAETFWPTVSPHKTPLNLFQARMGERRGGHFNRNNIHTAVKNFQNGALMTRCFDLYVNL